MAPEGAQDRERSRSGIVPAPPGPTLPAPAGEVLERLEAYARAARGAFSSNTEKAIRSDTAIFTAWAAEEGRGALPASPETIAEFVDTMGAQRAPATVRRYVSSIAFMHRAAGIHPLPTDSELVRLALKRMHREKGRKQRQAHGARRELVDRMMRAAGERPIDLRNKALLAVAYDTLCRRSELVGFAVENLIRQEEGEATLFLSRSKGDQEGEGAFLFLAVDTVQHLDVWLSAAGITEGPIFRGVHKTGAIRDPLNVSDVPRIFKRMAEAAGLDGRTIAAISGHSARVGAAQDMTALGFGVSEIMQQGRWKSPAMVARYGAQLEARRGASAKLARIQNRA